METRDWSLVFFTVLTQAAVGAFLTLHVLRYFTARRGAREGGREQGHPQDDGLETGGARKNGPRAGSTLKGGREAAFAGHGGHGMAVPLLVVLAVLSAGLFAALLHLSTPLQAARAVVNFSSSWLSREIVFGSLFAALLGALAWHECRAASAATWLPRLTAAAGLAFLGCQIAIYLLPAQPAWHSFATPAAFGGTALRLGILGVAAGLVAPNLVPGTGDVETTAARRTDPLRKGGTSSASLRGLALAGIAALALEFVVLPLHLASLAANPLPAAAASAQRLTGDYGGVLLLRLGLLGGAAAALGGVLATVRRPAGPLAHPGRRLASALACGAFGLVLASEVCGRFLFYAMRVRVGI